ncbi:mRNA-decapping enzyme [Acrasis kona]|uniref:mRNA-decapping enzyme n=1 Tax=Acrasis kona TaxID=1008807 RepID=A0AAW2ZBT6_9EUKA
MNTPSDEESHVKDIKMKMTLSVLKRQDDTVLSIIQTFEHAVMYKYTNDEWHKMNVEGPMFVVERVPYARSRYRFVVLNRKSTEKYHEDITPDLEIQLQLPYVMYLHKADPEDHNDQDQIYGVWFYNNVQSFDFAGLIGRLSGSGAANIPPTFPQQHLTESQPVPAPSVAADEASLHLKAALGIHPPTSPQPTNPLELIVKQNGISFNNNFDVRNQPQPREQQQQPTQVNHAASTTLLQLINPQPTNNHHTNQHQHHQQHPVQQEHLSGAIKELLPPSKLLEGDALQSLLKQDQEPTREEFTESLIRLIKYDEEYSESVYKMFLLMRKFGSL